MIYGVIAIQLSHHSLPLKYDLQYHPTSVNATRNILGQGDYNGTFSSATKSQDIDIAFVFALAKLALVLPNLVLQTQTQTYQRPITSSLLRNLLFIIVNLIYNSIRGSAIVINSFKTFLGNYI